MSAEQILTSVREIEPDETTILVKLNPASLSQDVLDTLARLSEPCERAKALRAWLRDRVAMEINRRLCDGHAGGAPREAEAWTLPWHTWQDDELGEALAASCSWLEIAIDGETADAIYEIHCAIASVCWCRLGELHHAIQLSQSRGK